MVDGAASEAAAAPPVRGAAFLLAVRQAANAAEAHRLFLQAAKDRAAPRAPQAKGPRVGAEATAGGRAARGDGADCEGFSRARVAAMAAAASYQRLLHSDERAGLPGAALPPVGAPDDDRGAAAGRRGRGAGEDRRPSAPQAPAASPGAEGRGVAGAAAAAAATAPAPRALFAAGPLGLEPPLPTDGAERPPPPPAASGRLPPGVRAAAPPGLEHPRAAGRLPRRPQPELPDQLPEPTLHVDSVELEMRLGLGDMLSVL